MLLMNLAVLMILKINQSVWIGNCIHDNKGQKQSDMKMGFEFQSERH